MTKSQLLAKIAELPEDAQICFALFDDKSYQWRLLQLNAQFSNDPANIIGLVTTPFRKDSLKELAT